MRILIYQLLVFSLDSGKLNHVLCVRIFLYKASKIFNFAVFYIKKLTWML
jgi:hypothetical protein